MESRYESNGGAVKVKGRRTMVPHDATKRIFRERRGMSSGGNLIRKEWEAASTTASGCPAEWLDAAAITAGFPRCTVVLTAASRG